MKKANKIKTNRSLFKYIVFGILTLGIYNLVFLHKLAKDMNAIGEGDRRHTRGVFAFLVFNLLTVGVYQYIWWYKLANRIKRNGARYHCYIDGDGTTVLLWMIFGSLLCGFGPLIAMYIVFHNMNDLADTYNKRNESPLYVIREFLAGR